MTGRGTRRLVRAAVRSGAAIVALAAATASAQAVPFRVESHLEPRVVGPGERVRFTIEVQGPGFQQPRLRPRFELDNLAIVGGPDSRHGISVGGPGGESGWHYSWTWWLEPVEAGSAGVDEVYLLVGDREVELPPRRIEVLREPLPGRRGGDSTSPRSAFEELVRRTRERFLGSERPDDADRPDLFLQAVATPARPYVGQRVLYTVYLYTRVNVRAVEAEDLPSFQGLWARRVELEPAGEQVEWEGFLYTRSPVFCKELFALAPGSFRLEPVRARFVVDRIARDRLFSTPVRVPVERVVESNPLEIDVRPLPAPDGAGAAEFSGAVGRLVVDAELAPEVVAVGQGATLTVTVAGDGHLDALPAPVVEPPAGLELIGPQSVPAPGDGEDGGARSWQYLLVPRRAGNFRLPAVEVGYFDPAAAKYRVARALPSELAARLATADDAAVSEPPRPIRSAALPAPPLPLWRSGLPWAFALPWAAALVVILVRRRPAGRSGWGSSAGAGHGLPGFRARLEDARLEERPRRAAAALERAWRDLLADDLGVPAEVPAASWPDELLERGVGRDACRRLRKLLEDVHYLRFAPELSATSALAGELAARSETLGREILRR